MARSGVWIRCSLWTLAAGTAAAGTAAAGTGPARDLSDIQGESWESEFAEAVRSECPEIDSWLCLLDGHESIPAEDVVWRLTGLEKELGCDHKGVLALLFDAGSFGRVAEKLSGPRGEAVAAYVLLEGAARRPHYAAALARLSLEYREVLAASAQELFREELAFVRAHEAALWALLEG